MSARATHPRLTSNLALIGGRGCGKSSISKRLCRMNRYFMLFSLDALVRYECGGASVPEVVEARGWRGFRELEWKVLEGVCAFPSGALLDCGGGVVVDLDESGDEVRSKRKISLLRKTARVVYLARDPEYLVGRVDGDPDRPSLSDRHSFREVLERRDPWYREAAHLVLEADDLEKQDIAERILEWFYAEASAPPG